MSSNKVLKDFADFESDDEEDDYSKFTAAKFTADGGVNSGSSSMGGTLEYEMNTASPDPELQTSGILQGLLRHSVKAGSTKAYTVYSITGSSQPLLNMEMYSNIVQEFEGITANTASSRPLRVGKTCGFFRQQMCLVRNPRIWCSQRLPS